jgi:predicted methyltransferase
MQPSLPILGHTSNANAKRSTLSSGGVPSDHMPGVIAWTGIVRPNMSASGRVSAIAPAASALDRASVREKLKLAMAHRISPNRRWSIVS